MDQTRIIQQGEVAKFQIAIADFNMNDNDFSLQLIYGYRRTTVEINKSQMFTDSDDNWYFTFDTDGMGGRITARCTWLVPDGDVSGGLREKVDEQFLCFVVRTPCPQFITCPACTSSAVTYTRTERSDVADDYNVLVDAQGREIITGDNMYVLVHKESNQ